MSRKDNLEYFFILIKRNPDRTIQFWQHKLGEVIGTSPKTVTDYLKTLHVLRRIKIDQYNRVSTAV